MENTTLFTSNSKNYNVEISTNEIPHDSSPAIEVKDQNDAMNLTALFCRRAGTKFYVENDQLKEVSTLKERITYFCNRKTIEAQVQRVVNRAITSLNEGLEVKKAELADKTLFNKYSQALKAIFNGSMARMSQRVYQRSSIEENSLLERLLSPELFEKKSAFIESLKALRTDDEDEFYQAVNQMEDCFFKYTYELFKLTQGLGIKPERKDLGSGGNYFTRHFYPVKDNIIFNIKPTDEGPYGLYNSRTSATFKRAFTFKDCLRGNSDAEAEVSSFLTSRSFRKIIKKSIVPPTQRLWVLSPAFNGARQKECSVQMFVKGCHALGEEIHLPEWKHALPNSWLKNDLKNVNLPKKEIQALALLGRVTGDTDNHFGNGLVAQKNVGQDNVARRLLDESRFSKKSGKSEEVTDDEIESFVDKFFTSGNNHTLLLELLFCTPDGKIFIKHDGGSSHPHSHPKGYSFFNPSGYLEVRFKDLITLLPQFDEPFCDEIRTNFFAQTEEYLKMLQEKAYRELHAFCASWAKENKNQVYQWVLNIGANPSSKELEKSLALFLVNNQINELELGLQGDSHTFLDSFIKSNANSEEICSFISLFGKEKEVKRWELISKFENSIEDRADKKQLMNAFKNYLSKNASDYRNHLAAFRSELKRIEGNINTRKEEWLIIADHMAKNSNASELFKIKVKKQYEGQLKKIDKKIVQDFNAVQQQLKTVSTSVEQDSIEKGSSYQKPGDQNRGDDDFE